MREYIYLIVIPYQLDHGLIMALLLVDKANFIHVCV